MIIEWVGLSGCGKTTLARSVKNELESPGRSAHWRPPLLTSWWDRREHVVRFPLFILTRLLSRQHLAFLLADGITPKNRYIREFLFQIYYMHRMRSICYEDVVLIDQGSVQALWAAFIGHDKYSKDIVRSLLQARHRIIGHSVLCVYVHVPPELAARRLELSRGRGERRGSGRFDLLERDVATRVLTSSTSIMEDIVGVLKEIDSETVIEIDGTRPLAEQAAMVTIWAARLMADGRVVAGRSH